MLSHIWMYEKNILHVQAAKAENWDIRIIIIIIFKIYCSWCTKKYPSTLLQRHALTILDDKGAAVLKWWKCENAEIKKPRWSGVNNVRNGSGRNE